jgi:hypothetical protein
LQLLQREQPQPFALRKAPQLLGTPLLLQPQLLSRPQPQDEFTHICLFFLYPNKFAVQGFSPLPVFYYMRDKSMIVQSRISIYNKAADCLSAALNKLDFK